MRHTRSHTKNRRSHHKIKNQPIVVDGATGVPHLRHRVCVQTGTYRGKQVLDTIKVVEKKNTKK
jgi:ribosomal protein L32